MEPETYDRVIFQLQLEITNQFETISNFCKNNGKESFAYENLTRLLSQKSGQKMSLATFFRIMHALGKSQQVVAPGSQALERITLPDYLAVNNNEVMNLVFKVIQF